MFLQWWVFCVVAFKVALGFCQARPAIYVDNGVDQTIRDHLMTEKEMLEIETDILHMLGLPRRPKATKSRLEISRSRYLLKAYNMLKEEEEGDSNRVKRDKSIEITSDEYDQIKESDVVIALETFPGNHTNVFLHRRGSGLWFNIWGYWETPMTEGIIGAQLKIFKNSVRVINYPYSKFRIYLWQIFRTKKGEKLELIDTADTTTDYNGWIKLNLTASMYYWLMYVDSNYGIYLTASPLEKPGKEIELEDIGVVLTKEEEEIKPFMVAFLRGTNQAKLRIKRKVTSKSKSDKFDEFVTVMTETHKYSDESRMKRKSCRLHNLFINFKELHWQDWILEPLGYSAQFCSGECDFPLLGDLNPTNHALIQSLVHLKNPGRFPKPSCAPTDLKSVSVVYLSDDHNAMLKKYRHMMVTSCGCQ